MPTIKDIAKVAGVSHATVSYVLNKKGNVSAETIRLVEKVADEMGYTINEAASSLRSGRSKVVAIILPNVSLSGYKRFLDGLEAMFSGHGYNTALYVTGDDGGKEVAAIDSVKSLRPEFLVVVSTLNDRDAYSSLVNFGTKVYFTDRVAASDDPYIGFDYSRIARDISRTLDCSESVGIFLNSLSFANEKEFAGQIEDSLKACKSNASVMVVQGVSGQYEKMAFSFFSSGNVPSVIITMNPDMAAAVLSVAYLYYDDTELPHIISLAPQNLLNNNRITYYELDYFGLGDYVAKHLLGFESESRTISNRQLDMTFGRCLRDGSSGSIRLFSIDTPSTDALRTLLPIFKKESGIDVQIVACRSNESLSYINQFEKSNPFDIIRMDMALLSRFGDSLFCRLDEGPFDLPALNEKMIEGIGKEYSEIHGVPYAIPFDPSVLMLFYRKDLFENNANVKLYKEMFKGVLAVPQNVDDYIQVSSFFDRDDNDTSLTLKGCSYTNLPVELIFLLRTFSTDDTILSMSKKEFIRAMQKMKSLMRHSYQLRNGWWGGAIDAFANKDCAMSIAYSNYAEMLSSYNEMVLSKQVGYSNVFSKKPFLGGGILGVSRNSEKKRECAEFFNWLYSDRIAILFAMIAGSSPCSKPYERSEILSVYPWLGTVKDNLMTGCRRSIFTNLKEGSDQIEFENALGLMIRNGLNDFYEMGDVYKEIKLLLTKGVR